MGLSFLKTYILFICFSFVASPLKLIYLFWVVSTLARLCVKLIDNESYDFVDDKEAITKFIFYGIAGT